MLPSSPRLLDTTSTHGPREGVNGVPVTAARADRKLVIEALDHLTPPRSDAARRAREILLERYGDVLRQSPPAPPSRAA
jgi:hypothetical protein